MMPVLAWVWMAAGGAAIAVLSGDLPGYVLRGKLFTEPFNIVHAGFALDQPTIGKWLFWFTVMTGTSLPYLTLVGWLANRSTTGGRRVFAWGVGLVGVLLLCLLSGPVCWLIQYVWSLGFTPRRILGLVYGVAGGGLVIGFFVWSLRHSGDRNAERCASPRSEAPGAADGQASGH